MVTHRVVTIPLLGLGVFALLFALLSALAVAALPGVSPLAMAGAGLICIITGLVIERARTNAALAKAEVILLPLEPATRHARVKGALVLVLVVGFLALAFMGPGASLATYLDEKRNADVGAAAVADGSALAAPLATEDFTGALQGARVPVIGGIGGTGTTDQLHPLKVPANATAARFELRWEAGTGQATQLDLIFEKLVGDTWEQVAIETGASILVLDAAALPADASEMRLHVSLPADAPSTPLNYALHAAYFEGDIPTDYTRAA